ncbi:MAG: hypothetical protein M9955_11730 [Rhizobiaceae bacterium]|nr:hypothetical protein [Rhizobiaceae bacterium]
MVGKGLVDAQLQSFATSHGGCLVARKLVQVRYGLTIKADIVLRHALTIRPHLSGSEIQASALAPQPFIRSKQIRLMLCGELGDSIRRDAGRQALFDRFLRLIDQATLLA